MSEAATLRRLRTFLRLLAAALFAGSLLELILAGHYEGAMQFVPFVLCGLGLAAVAAIWLSPGRPTVLALRLVMLGVLCGSALGVAQHFFGNRGFARETRPAASERELLERSLTGGVPLLAPGILAVAAAVAIAATFGEGGRAASSITRRRSEGTAAREPVPAGRLSGEG